MNNIESTRLYYIELGKLAVSLFEKIQRREQIEYHRIKLWGGSIRYVSPGSESTLMSVVEQYSPSTALLVIQERPEYVYLTYNECIYDGKEYRHSDFDLDNDFFSLSTVYSMEVLKVLTLGSFIYKELCKDIEQMVLFDIPMIENYYQYLMKEYGSAY